MKIIIITTLLFTLLCVACTRNYYYTDKVIKVIVHDTVTVIKKVVEYRDTCMVCIYDPGYKIQNHKESEALIREYQQHPERFWKILDHYHYGSEMRDSVINK